MKKFEIKNKKDLYRYTIRVEDLELALCSFKEGKRAMMFDYFDYSVSPNINIFQLFRIAKMPVGLILGKYYPCRGIGSPHTEDDYKPDEVENWKIRIRHVGPVTATGDELINKIRIIACKI